MSIADEIVGHSPTRERFMETDYFLLKKISEEIPIFSPKG